ncbi:helix-turn-helix transcriptional regulator [Butyricicoccus sp.]|uniref:helix-turn-helix transcriptional regulator n=1 Tax=Butyricicoccus sp. TaxID=2049021 RepID=UPI003AAAFCD1
MVRQLPREAEMLRKARIEMGYTQQQVATLIGVHIKAYRRLEYGERDIRNASMKIGLAICAVLCIDPMLLVFGGEFKAMAVFRTE